MADAKFSWNVFFKGPEGFKEHIQVQADDSESLSTGREGLLKTLKDIGATPENEPRGRGASPATQQPSAMVAAAVATGVSKVCPIHNVSMTYKAAGFSRTKTDAAGNPKPYSASWRCPERGCTTIEWGA